MLPEVLRQSPASRLRSAVLRVAARSPLGLSPRPVAGRTSSYGFLPHRCVQEGEQVLILGATHALSCAAAVRWCAPGGKLTVVEPTEAVLEGAAELIRRANGSMAGVDVRLVRSALEDLRTDPDFLSEFLAGNPVTDLLSFRHLESALAGQRTRAPLVPDSSADVVIADAALNRVAPERIELLLGEVCRVLKPGGRVVLTVLLVDERLPRPLPEIEVDGLHLRFTPGESEAADLLIRAGFFGISYGWRAGLPFLVIEGRELRAFVLEGVKAEKTRCLDQGHAVMYRGPFERAHDDGGHVYVRGERTSVCGKTFQVLNSPPYAGHFVGIEPYAPVPESSALPFDDMTPRVRDPRVTKGLVPLRSGREPGAAPQGKCC